MTLYHTDVTVGWTTCNHPLPASMMLISNAHHSMHIITIPYRASFTKGFHSARHRISHPTCNQDQSYLHVFSIYRMHVRYRYYVILQIPRPDYVTYRLQRGLQKFRDIYVRVTYTLSRCVHCIYSSVLI